MRCGALGLLACGLAALACSGGTKREAPRARVPVTLPERCEPEQGPDGRLLVDDFEDDDELLDAAANLHGLWYVENDGSGSQLPSPGERGLGALLDAPGSPSSTAHALHTSGSGFELWGAFVGVKLNASRFQACEYDLSAYSRLTLAVRGAGNMRVNVGTASTTPLDDWGACDSDTCSDYGTTLALEEDWRTVEIPLDQLTQPDWATAAEWEPARALRISFWAEQEPFDFWLDDVAFD